MDILMELKYYCNEEEPVGALMLTGEWGCGKTFLIENDLVNALKDTHVIVRISLFGIDSISTLNERVKRQWVSKCNLLFGKIQENDKALKVGRSIIDTAATFTPLLKDIKDSILAINPYDYISIQPVIKDNDKEKKVILVFDDLERSKLDPVDVLGCINEYCENLHFNTIIVANEEKLEKRSGTIDNDAQDIDAIDNLPYSEIKEKIVCRTIQYSADYTSIIHSIIEKRRWPSDDYKKFLIKNEQMIVSIFGTNEEVYEDKEYEKPHNIRSLKCALQDFYRVYKILYSSDIPDTDRYLYSFLAYSITSKSGIIKEDEKYGFIFIDQQIKERYPSFSTSTLLVSVRDWISYGRWDEDRINNDINLIREQLKPKEPKDILRINRFIDLEEEDIQRGFLGLLNDCYNGELTLNEYVGFINNSYFVRENQLDIPAEIDWDKIISGISIRFQKCIEDIGDDYRIYQCIAKESRDCYTPEELKAYDLIEQFRRNETLIFERNRNLYITSSQKNGLEVFSLCKHKRFNTFDSDMAKATCDCFDKCKQSDKSYFPGYFEDLWQFCDSSQDFNKESTKEGFEALIGLLEKLYENYVQTGHKIASIHTKSFITTVKKLVQKLDIAINSVY